MEANQIRTASESALRDQLMELGAKGANWNLKSPFRKEWEAIRQELEWRAEERNTRPTPAREVQ